MEAAAEGVAGAVVVVAGVVVVVEVVVVRAVAPVRVPALVWALALVRLGVVAEARPAVEVARGRPAEVGSGPPGQALREALEVQTALG